MLIDLKFLFMYLNLFRKLITRELQEWHKQQVSKYKHLTTESQTINPRTPPPTSQSQETDSMLASILPPVENARLTCSSSSFIVAEQPPVMSTSMSMPNTNDMSTQQDIPR